MTRARHARQLRLTRRGRVARSSAVLGVAALGVALWSGSGHDPAAVADAAGPDTVGTFAPAVAANTATSDATDTDLAAAAVADDRAGAASAPARPTAAKAPRVVVGFGDSVPSGAACSCNNFVSVYAQHMPGGAAVANYAEDGTTSSDALARLDEPAVAAVVRKATTVLIMTGANDFADAFANVSDGADPEKEYGSVAKLVRTNVATEVADIHKLNPGAHVVVLDYWGAMEDGQVAQQDYDADEQKAAAQATDFLNDALAHAAGSTNATFVSTMKAFKGADGKADPTPLLAADGDHPNAAGHRAIADAIAAILPRG